MQRVSSQANKEMVGAKQLSDLLADKDLPFGEAFCVEVADSAYSKPAYLNANREYTNLVTLARARGTRTFYRQPGPNDKPAEKGHPTWYGKPFRLKEPETWDTPDQVAETVFVSHKKVTYRVEIQAWYDLLMRGSKSCPMRQHPFTLVKIRWYNPKGEALFQKPLWLIVMGDRRMELSLLDIYEAYLQRYDLEHFFRFGKQNLLLKTSSKRPTISMKSIGGGWLLWLISNFGLQKIWLQICHVPGNSICLHQPISNLPRPWCYAI